MEYSNYDNKQVLITGGLGFIGSNLALRLAELNARVTVVDNLDPHYGGNLWNIEPIKDKIKTVISDVRDQQTMRSLIQGQDVLFNLAGQTSHVDSMEDPYTDLEINARAQLSILEACRHDNPAIKIVFTSTRQIYGKPDSLPVDEAHPIRPVDVNGIHKFAGEQYHLLYDKVYNIHTCVLRLTNTYGPRMRIKDARQIFLGIWMRNLIEGKPILVYGDGSQIRDFNYVDDVVDALLVAGQDERANGAIYNVGSSEKISLAELARLLIDINHAGEYQLAQFPENRKAIDIGDYWTNTQKIKQQLGWSPKTQLAVGLQKTLDYFKDNFSHYKET